MEVPNMNRTITTTALLVATFFGVASSAFAQVNDPRFASLPAAAAPQANPRFTFMLFWKEDNASTREIAQSVKNAVAKRADRAQWTDFNVTDPKNAALIEKYKLSRAPMPLVLCVAPNGAVTGGFPQPINDEHAEGALVTPTMTNVMKNLQEGKIVVVHVKAMPNAALPNGAIEFANDPSFQNRTALVSFNVNDPAERRFLKDMEITPNQVNGSMVSVLAPPGVLVGKYPANVMKTQIAYDLHSAGKCCDDPNCKHNQKPQ
jgi:hypothetical protein